MLSRVTTSIQRNIGVFALALCILIGGMAVVVKATTDHLLRENATTAAYWWARYLASNVTDLEQIASGELPSMASTAFFQGTRRLSRVFRYVIFNREGYSQLVSDQSGMAMVELSEFSQDAVRAVQTQQPVIGAREGTPPDQPAYFAEAYIPVVAEGRTIAVVAAYIDETAQRNSFYNTFLVAVASLCLLIGICFAVPIVAWYRRTKEKQRADARIRFLAHHDALTGLANRARLFERLDAVLASMPAGSGLAVHFIDLDRFKDVNDTFGHDGGDFLLKTVAARLRATANPADIVARLGGDEFVVVQLGVADKAVAEAFGARLLAALAEPMAFLQHEIVATVSVGVATAPTDGTVSDRLLKSADLAVYRSKAEGRNCVSVFAPEMDSEADARIALERTIRKALSDDGFELHYQPLVETPGRRLIGYEALLRLRRADGTLIAAADFIPMAEDMGLIERLGGWAVCEACAFAASWPEDLVVAVNLSPAQFAPGSISRLVGDALRKSGLDPRRLELEMNEKLLLGDGEAVMEELRALKATGVSLVIDDFGGGHSNLSSLWRFPFDKIKIDRSFVQALDGSGRQAEAVLATIAALGRELRMRVAIEGVENAAQEGSLGALTCDQAQGFLLGRPMPAPEVAADILARFPRSGEAVAQARGTSSKRTGTQ